MTRKHTWSHNRQCDYCQELGVPLESFTKPSGSGRVTGCRHFRGGKSAKHGRYAKNRVVTMAD